MGLQFLQVCHIGRTLLPLMGMFSHSSGRINCSWFAILWRRAVKFFIQNPCTNKPFSLLYFQFTFLSWQSDLNSVKI